MLVEKKICIIEEELLVSHDELTREELMNKLVSIEVHSKEVYIIYPRQLYEIIEHIL